MSHTYTKLVTHMVFSTKYRQPLMDADLRDRLFPYIGGIIRECGSRPVLVNGVADHVHILGILTPRVAVSDLLRTVKCNSARWVHQLFPGREHFAWQTGFAAFSVYPRALETVKAYIASQEEHHRNRTFEEELLRVLEENGIDYDEKYLWD